MLRGIRDGGEGRLHRATKNEFTGQGGRQDEGLGGSNTHFPTKTTKTPHKQLHTNKSWESDAFLKQGKLWTIMEYQAPHRRTGKHRKFWQHHRATAAWHQEGPLREIHSVGKRWAGESQHTSLRPSLQKSRVMQYFFAILRFFSCSCSYGWATLEAGER